MDDAAIKQESDEEHSCITLFCFKIIFYVQAVGVPWQCHSSHAITRMIPVAAGRIDDDAIRKP